MTRFRMTGLLVGYLCCATALAQSPGPTDPAGPQLQQPDSPRTGTQMREPAMDEQIERGTLIDRQDVLDDPPAPPSSAPPSDTRPAQPDRPLEPR